MLKINRCVDCGRFLTTDSVHYDAAIDAAITIRSGDHVDYYCPDCVTSGRIADIARDRNITFCDYSGAHRTMHYVTSQYAPENAPNRFVGRVLSVLESRSTYYAIEFTVYDLIGNRPYRVLIGRDSINASWYCDNLTDGLLLTLYVRDANESSLTVLQNPLPLHRTI